MRNQLYRNLHWVYAGLSAIVFAITAYYFGADWPSWLMSIGGAAVGFLAYGLFYWLLQMLGKWLKRIPLQLGLSLLTIVACLVVAQILGFGWPTQVYFPAAAAVVVLLLAMVASWSTKGKRLVGLLGVLVPVALLGWGLSWVLGEGHDPFPGPAIGSSAAPALSLRGEGVENPTERGRFVVEQFTYGSGTDQRRSEYADGVRFQTSTVDATRLLPEWKGKKKKWRERYWGFGVDAFPLNGRVYIPKGEGPFPLALIVHGNHSMTDYSDGGYAYLGELLASRGTIVVSVDENFVNGHWSGDFRGKEMPARAWLLLKHLEQWEKWNEDSDHELYGRVDMSKTMLLGHSRGGEAVSIAAVFNKLPFFPDDAREVFDFGFNITGVISIAPTDYRYHRQMNLENINYLSLQGSYDADETGFWGMRPYQRLQFTDSTNYIKAGVYIHRANHGQFNSSWGRSDFGGNFARFLNTKPLISGEDQRQAAKLFISAFTEVIFRDQLAYQSLFLAPKPAAAEWLPTGHYLGRFTSSRSRTLQDYEEDINLHSGGDSIQLSARNAKVWREETLQARQDGDQQNNVLVLGWHHEPNTTADSLATYTFTLPDSLHFSLDSFQHVIMDIGIGQLSELKDAGVEEELSDSVRIDFSVELISRTGEIGRTTIGESGHLPAPPLRSRFMKLASLDEGMFEQDREVQLETFALPMIIFQTPSGQVFDWRALHRIRLKFDKTPSGVVVIDNLRLGWD